MFPNSYENNSIIIWVQTFYNLILVCIFHIPQFNFRRMLREDKLHILNSCSYANNHKQMRIVTSDLFYCGEATAKLLNQL